MILEEVHGSREIAIAFDCNICRMELISLINEMSVYRNFETAMIRNFKRCPDLDSIYYL